MVGFAPGVPMKHKFGSLQAAAEDVVVIVFAPGEPIKHKFGSLQVGETFEEATADEAITVAGIVDVKNVL